MASATILLELVALMTDEEFNACVKSVANKTEFKKWKKWTLGIVDNKKVFTNVYINDRQRASELKISISAFSVWIKNAVVREALCIPEKMSIHVAKEYAELGESKVDIDDKMKLKIKELKERKSGKKEVSKKEEIPVTVPIQVPVDVYVPAPSVAPDNRPVINMTPSSGMCSVCLGDVYLTEGVYRCTFCGATKQLIEEKKELQVEHAKKPSFLSRFMSFLSM